VRNITFNKDDIICAENSGGEVMYIVKSGSARVIKTINGEQIELLQLKPGDFFGEMSLLLASPRTATVVACEETVIQEISRETMLLKIKQDPHFAYAMIKTLAGRIKDAHQVITNLQGEKLSLQVIYGQKDSI
jgi:CRP/FNR family cyclic AMP-dependent transcriptional regulator